LLWKECKVYRKTNGGKQT